MYSLLILISIFTSSLVGAQSNPKAAFQSGLETFKNGQYSVAVEHFQEVAKTHPKDSHLLYNLALAEFHTGQKGYAVAFLRKALSLDPFLQVANETFEYFRKGMPHLSSEQLVETGWFFSYLPWLRLIPVFVYGLFTLALAFFLFWLILSHVGASRRSEREGNSAPGWKPSVFILITLLGIFGTLTIYRIYDESMAYGTVLSEEVSIKAAPQSGQVELGKAFMGQQLRIRQKLDSWVQVEDGSNTIGWVEEASILQTQGWDL